MSGAVVSGAVTVQVTDAGVASVLPAMSVARASNVCAPTASELYADGDVQPPMRRRQGGTRTSMTRLLAVNAIVALVDAVEPDGPDVIVVLGGVVSGPLEAPYSNAPASGFRPT